MQDVLMWSSAVLNACGFVAAGLVLIIYSVAWFKLGRSADTYYVITTQALRRWLIFNAVIALILALTALRWLVIHDIANIRGVASADGPLDDVAWAALDLILTLTPVLLLASLRTARRYSGDNAGEDR